MDSWILELAGLKVRSDLEVILSSVNLWVGLQSSLWLPINYRELTVFVCLFVCGFIPSLGSAQEMDTDDATSMTH